MEELIHDGLQRVKLSRSGILCGWRTLLEMLDGSSLLDVPPHHISAEETSAITAHQDVTVLTDWTRSFICWSRL